jgi:outer membrane protein
MLEYVLVSFLKNSLACVAVVSMIALAPQPVFAETIYQAMAKAYENNPDLNAARAGLRATDEGVALAKSGYRPFIGAEATTTSTNASGRVTNSASVGVSITQTLFDGFQTRNNVRAAEAAVFAGRENLRGTEIDILLATVQAYANVNRDNQIVVYRKQNIAFLQEQFSAARARFDVGESTRTDVSLAEAQLAGAKASLTAAVAQAKSSAAVYAQIVGSIPKNLKPVPLPSKLLPASLDIAVAQGTREHPAVLAALFGVDAAGYKVKSEEGAFLPGVTVSGSVCGSRRRREHQPDPGQGDRAALPGRGCFGAGAPGQGTAWPATHSGGFGPPVNRAVRGVFLDADGSRAGDHRSQQGAAFGCQSCPERSGRGAPGRTAHDA